jgi:hypothetical protein
VLDDDERLAWLRDRQGVVVGRKLAGKFGWKVGDSDPAARHHLPRHLDLHLRAIYDGADAGVDENQMLLHWQLPQRDACARATATRAATSSASTWSASATRPTRR